MKRASWALLCYYDNLQESHPPKEREPAKGMNYRGGQKYLDQTVTLKKLPTPLSWPNEGYIE